MLRFDELLDAVNPVFALTVRMQSCRKIFLATLIVYCLVLIGLLVWAIYLPTFTGNFTQTDFFELGFLAATCCTLVFLGSDFGTVFIESTFQDELLRLTLLTPLQIIHGGISSGFFFSFGLLCPAFPLLAMAFLLDFPVERLFWATLLLFLIGQTFNLILLSFYLYAKSWKEIGFGVSITFLVMVLLGIFYFTELGNKLVDPIFWYIPIIFLFIVTTLTMSIAYMLARNHACHPKRSFQQTVLINFAVYLPFLILVCVAAVFLPL
ncbi:MAG: hypothetical protein LBC02_02045 [Planctomycetaceae bacterium]|jgi:hypothetical protein|nr:hypothetical protein [Planctomycetaceae bacterium]